MRRRHDCGGVMPVSWCAEHGDAVGPVMEWHPEGGIRCTALAPASRRPRPVGRTAGLTDDENTDAPREVELKP